MSFNKEQPPPHSIIEKTNVNQAIPCHVCGIGGASKHFGAICCAPCKMFFRRNIQYDLKIQKCSFSNQCNVTGYTRHSCRFCRLKKCFCVGMQKELIRASHHPHTAKQKMTRILPVIYPLNLLQNDRSLLTKDQWCFLSNVVHGYDYTSPLSNILDALNIQSTYPLKIRMKVVADSLLNVISSVFRAIGPFVELLPQFSALQVSDKNELIERHFQTVGGFGGILILREANVYSNPIYKNSLTVHYGSELFDEGFRIAERHEIDGTVVKLFVAALFFLTCTDVVYHTNYYHNDDMTSNGIYLFSNIKKLISIQNIYIETLFKYMLYRYGFRDATLRFAALIKNFLDQGVCLNKAGEHQMQNEMIEKIRIDTIVTSTLHS